jgi:acyl carrier protein
MNSYPNQNIRSFVLNRFAREIASRGLDLNAIDDNFDLMNEGLIDSLGLVELISAVETEFGKPVDLSDLDPEKMTLIGPLSKYLSDRLS